MYLVPHQMPVASQPSRWPASQEPFPGTFRSECFSARSPFPLRPTSRRHPGAEKHLDLSNRQDCIVKCQNECGGQEMQLAFSEKVKSSMCYCDDKTLVGT